MIDLRIPRYKVIAPYPDMITHGLKKGDVIELNNVEFNGKVYYNIGGFNKRIYDYYYDNYPHIFRKLSWEEERTGEEALEILVQVLENNDSNVECAHREKYNFKMNVDGVDYDVKINIKEKQ